MAKIRLENRSTMSTKTALVLVMGFIAGTALSVFGPAMVAPATAQTAPAPTATPTRWEAQCARYEARREDDLPQVLTDAANAAGYQGWELVSFSHGDATDNATLCFKRPRR